MIESLIASEASERNEKTHYKIRGFAVPNYPLLPIHTKSQKSLLYCADITCAAAVREACVGVRQALTEREAGRGA